MKTKPLYFILMILGVLGAPLLADIPLETVGQVELAKYLGKWFELGSLPGPFQKGCVATQATYSEMPDGRISILNECRDKTLDGKLRVAKGTAWVVDKEKSAKLKVRFFWPFTGDYWILNLGSHYEYAIVGEPRRRYAWILSRTPHISEDSYLDLVDKLKKHGYDLTHFQRTAQP